VIWTGEHHRQQGRLVAGMYQSAAGVPDERSAIIAGGLPGADKAAVLDRAGVDRSRFLTVSIDAILDQMAGAGLIPEADGLSPLMRAGQVHAEAQHLAKRVLLRALMDGRNLILDISLASWRAAEAWTYALRFADYTLTAVFADMSVDEAVQRAGEARRGEQHAGDVDAGEGLGVARLLDHAQRQRHRRRDQRDVDPEDRPPGDQPDQRATARRAEDGGDPGPRGPGADRLPARLALEGGGDDRQRPRHQQRPGDPLQRPRADQELLARGERAEDRGRAEGDQPDDEEPPPAELVPEAAADEEQRDHRQHVGLDHPLLSGQPGAEAHALTDPGLTRLIRIWLANRGIWEALPGAGPTVPVPATRADVQRYVSAYGELLAALR